MKKILSQEDFNNAINSTGSGVIACYLKEGNDKYEFCALICLNNYILDYNGEKALIQANKLMDSPIGKAIKTGNLYVLEYGNTR